jgi:predicted amidohydrolase YtcJ
MKRTTSSSCAILLALVFLVMPGRAQAQSADDLMRKLEQLQAYPELIVVNGNISTMDERLSEFEAMAVKNNRILALGTNDEIRFLAGPNTEVLDAKGRRVLPGLIDGHTHPHLWAVEHWMGSEGDFAAKQYNDPQLQIFYAKGNDQATVLRELERIVRERVAVLGPGKWIWASVFGGNSLVESRKIVYSLFPQGAAAGGGGTSAPLTREFLDTLAPDNPLMVMVGEAIGPGANNTKAKEEMERILGVERVGLYARTAVTYDILFKGRTEEKMDFLKRELLECVVAQGITTFGNHYYGSPSIMETYNLLYQRGELPVRWAWYMGGGGQGWSSDYDLSLTYRNLGNFQKIGNDYIWNAGVADEGWEWGPQGEGGIGTCTAAEPNPADPVELFMSCSDPKASYEQYGGYRNVKAALEAGLRIGYLHVYSDGSMDALLHLIEQSIADGKVTLEQVRAARISTEHNPMLRPDQAEKMAMYGIMPGFNGYQVQGDIKGGAFLKVYGEQYMPWIAPVKTMADAGVKVVFNTDAHINKVLPESKDMDYPPQWDGNIWGFMEFFASRRMPHDGITYNQSEALDKVTLMKAATIWGAEQAMNEENIGSLELGKLADFIVIDKDYFAIPADQIGTIKTLLTAVGGKVVFQAPGY